MKDMENWAVAECKLACKKVNPDFDFDSDDFDYTCSCYKSALKAYQSLCEDGHSGMSWSLTKNILEKLMSGQPLSPITDEDFFGPKGEMPLSSMNDEWLQKKGLKSCYQCPRMSSLFRYETLDGKIYYDDMDRVMFIDIDDPILTYYSSADFLNEMYPITMPYTPKKNPYKIYTRTFLTDKNNGDFDTKGIMYMITPEGERVELNIFLHEIDGKMQRITKEEYDELYNKRITRESEVDNDMQNPESDNEEQESEKK